MRIRGDPLAAGFLPIVEQLGFAQASFDERATVDARRDVTLHIDQVAAVLFRRGVPEVTPTDVIQQRGRLEAGDVAAQFGGILVGAKDDRHGVPADRRADLVFDRAVARGLLFPLNRNGVAVGRGERRRTVGALAPGVLDQRLHQIVRTLVASVLLYRPQGVEPFSGLQRVVVRHRFHKGLTPCSDRR